MQPSSDRHDTDSRCCKGFRTKAMRNRSEKATRVRWLPGLDRDAWPSRYVQNMPLEVQVLPTSPRVRRFRPSAVGRQIGLQLHVDRRRLRVPAEFTDAILQCPKTDPQNFGGTLAVIVHILEGEFDIG